MEQERGGGGGYAGLSDICSEAQMQPHSISRDAVSQNYLLMLVLALALSPPVCQALSLPNAQQQ